ncbi:hypothetical protein BJ166DRAFT_611357 [Pestalotiopsis sp. NC0098]|nr:hypothetical protein BJ166DRAFT_611357 [Pestalotiopsis sp. NC0098]
MAPLGFELQGCTPGGTIDEFELAFARRSLARIKAFVGRDGLFKLLEPELDRSDEYWRRVIQQSGGKMRAAEIKVSATGITLQQMLSTTHMRSQDEPWMLAGHPEHYLIHEGATKEIGLVVCETLGSHTTYFTMALDQVDARPEQRKAEFPASMTGKGYLRDGTHVVNAAHEFRESEDGNGFEAVLRIDFPAAVDDALLETHRQHLAVEFRHWTAVIHHELHASEEVLRT